MEFKQAGPARADQIIGGDAFKYRLQPYLKLELYLSRKDVDRFGFRLLGSEGDDTVMYRVCAHLLTGDLYVCRPELIVEWMKRQ